MSIHFSEEKKTVIIDCMSDILTAQVLMEAAGVSTIPFPAMMFIQMNDKDIDIKSGSSIDSNVVNPKALLIFHDTKSIDRFIEMLNLLKIDLASTLEVVDKVVGKCVMLSGDSQSFS